MVLMTCNNCGLKGIQEYCVREWGYGYCPVCGADLKKQLDEADKEPASHASA